MIKIVTDSIANLPPEVARDLEIAVIPAYVTFDNETLREDIDITSTEFFKRLAASPTLPVTSQPSVQDFETLYRKILTDHPGVTIISLHISAQLSGTLASARQAAARVADADIRLFDTRSVTLGQALMVRQAAEMARRGENVEAILARLGDMRDRLRFYATLDTLDYLAKGGRIGRAARLLGTVLDMKPIIFIREGAVDAYGRQRSRARAIGMLRSLVLQDAAGVRGLHLAVMHGACEAEARQVADELVAALHPEVFLFGEVGPTLGTYVGPGTIGVTWYFPAG